MESETQVAEIEETNLHNIDEPLEKKFSFFKQKNNEKDFWPYDATSRKLKFYPTTISEYGNRNNEFIFTIDSFGYMDPKTTRLNFQIKNNSTNNIILDESIHSIIDSFEVMINGVVVEKIEDYNHTHKIKSQLSLSKSKRIERRINEGFSIDGSIVEEMIKPESNPTNETESIKAISNFLTGDYLEINKIDLRSLCLQTIKTSNLKEITDLKEKIYKEMKNNEEKCKNLLGNYYEVIRYVCEPQKVNTGKNLCEVETFENSVTIPKYREFSLRLESGIIGELVSEKNWKLIPMEALKVQIKFVLSQDYGSLENSKGTTIAGLRIIDPYITFKEYSFTNEWSEFLKEYYMQTPMVFDYYKYELVMKKWIEKMDQSLFYFNFKPQNSIYRLKAMFAVFLSNNENLGTIKKPFEKINPGYTKMQIQNDTGPWPSDDSFKGTEIWNSEGSRNLIEKIKKNSFGIKYRNIKSNGYNKEDYEIIIDEKSISLPFTRTKENRDNYIECKTINGIFFDTTPYGDPDVICGGVPELKVNNNYIIVFKRNDKAQKVTKITLGEANIIGELSKSDLNATLCLFAQYNVKIKMSFTGEVVFY